MRAFLPDDPALIPTLAGVADGLKRVEEIFARQLRSDLPAVQKLVVHVDRYRGKMLRPTLALLCGMAAGGRDTPDDRLATVGAVCEMVHMATLVHDDVLDEADVRRRGPTINALRGNEAAVILGDYLIASAFHLCSGLDSPEYALNIGRASMLLCAGELLQLHHREDLSLDEPTYFEIVERKTGALVASACRLGARAGGASDAAQHAMDRFGLVLGAAFQIQDDLLDLGGEESVVGKSVRKDLEKGKLTLPLIHHLAHAGADDRGRMLRLLELPARDEAQAREIRAALERTESVAYARQTASRLVNESRGLLSVLPEGGARRVLDHLAGAVIDRGF